MIRSIAKFLIQYSYDSGLVSTNADRLPRWLRRWVNSDSHLRDYEHELLRLESKLVSQASKRVASGAKSGIESASAIRTQPTPARSSLRSPAALAALAASLACVLLVGRWLVSTWEDTRPEVIVNTTQTVTVKEENALASAKERWIRTTLSATKRLATKLNEKGNEATGSLAIANRTLNQESELIKSAGLAGLRFVAQKLPAATVRMMGLSDPNRN
ncbi:MAG: hypothetical protein NTY15_06415 [Planctomycetota bacterium]|nr:hypothetical protein [Planctomycetota bacterium]